MSKRNSSSSGLLVVDKPGRACALVPTGSSPEATERDFPTSHDVVQRVRRWSHQRRIGHTGTLDPMASGVLVLCLGQSTRLVEYYQNHPKQYYAEITLGSATDTYDAFGEETARAPVPPLSTAAIEKALDAFRGDILQTPPLYSAIKQGGESLHRKARRGEEVTVVPRPVTFYQLDLLHYGLFDSDTFDSDAVGSELVDDDGVSHSSSSGGASSREKSNGRADDAQGGRIALRVRCSAGGYIRSLAHDLGQALDTVAHLSGLRREAAGPFTLDDAHSMAAIEAAAHAGKLEQLLLPPGARLDMPRLVLDADTVVRLGQGQRVVLSGADVETAAAEATDDLAQGIDAAGNFMGVVRHVGPAQITSADANTAVNTAVNTAASTGTDSDARQGSIWKAEKWFVT